MSIYKRGHRSILKGNHRGKLVLLDVREYRYKKFVKSHTFTYGALLLMAYVRLPGKSEIAARIGGHHNRVSNFRWMTRPKALEILHKQNAENGIYKLNEKKVKKIKQLADAGITTTPLSKMFNLSKMQIQRVVRGDSWPDVLPGLSRKKEKKAGTSLTIVNKIKRALKGNNVNQKKLAQKYGVGETTVSRIKLGKYYKS
jgi:hypothetical protein